MPTIYPKAAIQELSSKVMQERSDRKPTIDCKNIIHSHQQVQAQKLKPRNKLMVYDHRCLAADDKTKETLKKQTDFN